MVCKSSITSTGPTTAFRQQYSLLWASGVLHPDPRRQFLTDLQEFLVTHQTLGDRILLLGDFNTDLDHPQESRQLQDLLSLLHLTDVMTHCHPDLPPGSEVDASTPSTPAQLSHTETSNAASVYIIPWSILITGRSSSTYPPTFSLVDLLP